MYVRTAFVDGDLNPEQLAAFKSAMTLRIAPLVKTFPGVRSLELFWVAETELESTKTVLMMQHRYDDEAAFRAAMASDQRNTSMPITMALLEEYGLSVYHVNHELDPML